MGALAAGPPKSEPESSPTGPEQGLLIENPQAVTLDSLSGREREPLKGPVLALTDKEAPLEEQAFVLKSKEEQERASRLRFLWAGGAVMLALGLGIQYASFHGQELLDRYPGLRPPLEQFCVLLGCELPIRRDPEAVRLLSRDVRLHPRYQDALLVNAILVNEASFTQPYPVLQLEFSDISGTPLAARRLQPAEYLDKSIRIEEGLPPGLPVHIVLELQWLKQAPVSFEFKFL